MLFGDLMTDVQRGNFFMELFLLDKVESLRELQELLLLLIELFLVQIQSNFIFLQQARQGLPDFLIEIES